MSVKVPQQYQAQVTAAAKALGVSPDMVAEQFATESGWDPTAVSPTGAEGLAQFEPGTWATYGQGSPFDPNAAFAAYTAYMTALLKQFKGDVRNALAAYNAGPNNLQAGYGYADGILKASHQGSQAGPAGGAHTGSGGAGDFGSGLIGGILQLPDQITGVFTALEKPVQALAWFLNPTNWARILSGGVGVLLLIAGLIALGMAV